MPLRDRADFGTGQDGHQAEEYCRYCYANGRFTDPGITLVGMTDLCARVLRQRGMPEAQARAMMTGLLPQLKRWRSSALTPAG